jgi:hypothetical protein
MAKTVVGIKIKTKAPKRDPLFDDEAHVGTEPIWDTAKAEKMSDSEFDNELRKSFRYYNYFYNQKDLKKYVVAWLKENKKLTSDQLDSYSSSSPDLTPMTAVSLAKAVTVGMPLRQQHSDYIMDSVMKAIELSEGEVPKKVKKTGDPYVPTIQERLAEKTAETIGEIEGMVDNAFLRKPNDRSVYDFLTMRAVPQSQVGKIRAVFQKQVNELAEAALGTDKQLNEGYSHLKKADLKQINIFYTQLLADIDNYTAVKKATKAARKPKVVSKEKQVAKVKFLKESKELKVVSVSPASIIGASAVWVYDVRRRKIGRYVADTHSGTLGVKGTSIIGFDPVTSVAKTVRKPAEQIKEFLGIGKVALRTYMKTIKAVEVKLTGRLNEDVLILKVE